MKRLVLTLACALGGCRFADPPPAASRDDQQTELQANRTSLEPVAFVAGTDYFPHKVVFRRAKQLRVEYHNYYKIARFLSNTIHEEFTFVLVQRGAPKPQVGSDAIVIDVPLRRFAVGSYRYGGTIDLFGLADRLVGYRPARRATTPGLIATLKANRVSEDLSAERLLHVQPDATFHYFANGQLQREMSPLTSVGLREIPMAEHMETDPLAKAEWIKFLALFFNKEEQAERYFADIERRYNEIAALSKGVRYRPKVFVDEPVSDGWQIFGGNNSTARMIEDAGGEYVFRDDPTSASIRKISYELALDRGLDAPVWLITFDATHRNDLAFRIWNDPRLRNFRSLRESRVFIAHRNFLGLLNPYWDQGLPNPHLLLADVVRILHPELLPDHDLVFFRKLERPGR